MYEKVDREVSIEMNESLGTESEWVDIYVNDPHIYISSP